MSSTLNMSLDDIIKNSKKIRILYFPGPWTRPPFRNRYSIHYDRSGRSKGTTEVVFIRPAEAVAAVKRYNKVQLDGKPMKIEIVGTNFAPPHANAAFGNSNGLSGR
ncbi:hypothetical protein POTOM_034009 [Populus tomentosa]|uniref:RRM domain-containing protein n=1 Tax=Populus tomentosa TaxID=118781 RepID=A0A8X7Z1C9_POPTO|nr:hypothetical protein POTOM_034009 [Populus tomentosa]